MAEAGSLAMGGQDGNAQAQGDPRMVAISTLPALVGVGLAIIYSLGAIETAAQLRGEGLRLIDAFPLIPLSQVLSRGIVQTMGYGLVLLVVLTTMIGVDLFPPARMFARLEGQWGPIYQGARVGEKLALQIGTAIALLISLGYLALVFFVLPWPVWIAGAFMSIWFFWVRRWFVARAGRWRGLALASLSFVFVVGGLGSLVFPDHLPKVRLDLIAGRPIQGTLVTNSAETWYVATDAGVEVVSSQRVRTAIVAAPSRPIGEAPSLADLLGRL